MEKNDIFIIQENRLRLISMTHIFDMTLRIQMKEKGFFVR
jgi:hypothetical protein